MAADPPPSPLIQNLFDFFRRMAKELRNHMREEEEVVFPYLVEVEKAFQRGAPPRAPLQGYNAFTHPIHILQEDHGKMGRDWMKIEETTKGFAKSPRTTVPCCGPSTRPSGNWKGTTGSTCTWKTIFCPPGDEIGPFEQRRKKRRPSSKNTQYLRN